MAHDRQAVGVDLLFDDLQVGDLVGADGRIDGFWRVGSGAARAEAARVPVGGKGWS